MRRKKLKKTYVHWFIIFNVACKMTKLIESIETSGFPVLVQGTFVQ